MRRISARVRFLKNSRNNSRRRDSSQNKAVPCAYPPEWFFSPAQGFPRARGRSLETAAAAILNEEGVTLPRTALAELIDRSGGDLLFIREEARKLAAYLADKKTGHEAVTGLFYSGGEESVYPLLDRFGERDLHRALAELRKLHEAPSRLFPALLRELD